MIWQRKEWDQMEVREIHRKAEKERKGDVGKGKVGKGKKQRR